MNQNFASNDALTAQVGARDADMVRARAQFAAAQGDLARAKVDLDRREALREMVRRYSDNMHTNQPVHTWEL